MKRNQYRYVDVSDIDIPDCIMPKRETQSKGLQCLDGEDMAFLCEGWNERAWTIGGPVDRRNSFAANGSDGYRFYRNGRLEFFVPKKIQAAMDPEHRLVARGISELYGIPPDTGSAGYTAFIRPDKAYAGSNVKINGLDDLSPGNITLRLVEDKVVKLEHLVDGFSPVNPVQSTSRVDWDEERKRLTLSPDLLRTAFWDLKRLQYIITPVALDNAKVHMSSEKGYDENHPEREMYGDEYTRSIDLTVVAYTQPVYGVKVSFPDIGCYCRCSSMVEDDSTCTIYMSEKGNTDSGGEHDDPEGVICCVSSVDVYADRKLPLMDLGFPADRIRRTIVVYRIWHRLSGEDGDGSNPPVMDNTYRMMTCPSSGYSIAKKYVKESFCRELLADAGYPTEIDDHPDPNHTESCGVDIAAVFLIIEPEYRTDLSHVDCPH